jgi:TP901 family phage tail tape measure protein
VIEIAIIASQLIGQVSLTGIQQAQADMTSMSTKTKSAQADLAQLQSVANEVSNVVQNRFAVALRDSQGSLQALASQASNAGLDTSKLSELQAKAAVAADNLAVAQDRAAMALQKAANITIDAASSEDQIVAAQNQASLAADKVVVAENAAAAAMGKVSLEASTLSNAVMASSEKTSIFSGMMGRVHEASSGFFGGLKAGVGGLLEFGSKVGMTVLGIQTMVTMFMGAADAAGKMIGDFQQQMTKLTTTAGESQSNIKMVGEGILQMAGPTATSVKQLGDAMYWVESGGARGKKALEDLKIAAMGAKAENADLTDVTKALMFTLNNYGDTGLTAAGAMNTLITAVAGGSLSLQDLSSGISNVMPTAHAFGISLTDVAAGLATMSAQGDPAAAAATHLAMMIKTIEAPSAAGSKALASIGLTTQQVSDEMRKSMPGALELIIDHLKNKFPEGSTAYNEALKNISGGSRSMQAILETTGSRLDVFKQNVDKITGAVKEGGDSIAGWAEVQKNFNFRMDQSKAAVGALAVKIGTELAPAATQLLGFFTDKTMPALNRFSDWFSSVGIPALKHFPAAVSEFFAPLTTAIGWLDNFVGHGQAAIPILAGIGGVITAILVPAIIAALPPLAALAIEVVAATWPFVAIAVAVGALTAVFLHFYNTSADFRNVIANIGEAMKGVWAFLVDTFTPVWIQLQDVWKNQMQPAASQLMDTFKQMQPELKVVAEILGGVLLYQIGVLVADIGFLVGALSGIWKGAADMIGGYVQIFAGYVQVIVGFISLIVDLFTGKFSKLGPDLKVILGGVGEIFTGFGNVLKGIVDGIVGGVTGGFRGMGVSVIGYLNDIVHGVQDKTTQAKDAADINTLQMKINSIKHAEETDLGVIQRYDHMRMGIADQLSKTKDDTEKKSLGIKLTQVTHAEDTAVKVWESHKKMRVDSESELDKLKTSFAQKWGTIQQDIQGFFGNIGHWFSDRFAEARKGIVDAWGNTGKWFQDRGREIQNVFAGIGNETQAIFAGMGRWFTDRWHETQAVFMGIGAWFHDRWSEAWSAVTGFFGGIGQWFNDRWAEVMGATKPFRDYMGDVFQTIWNILVALWGKLGAKFNEWLNDARIFFTPFVNFVHDKFAEAWAKVTAVWGFLGKYFNDRLEETKKILGFVGGVFYVAFKAAWDFVVGIWNFLGKWFGDRWQDTKNILGGVGNFFHDLFKAAWDRVTGIWNFLGKWFSDKWEETKKTLAPVTGWFHDLFQGAWDKVTGVWGFLGKWFNDRWNEVLGGVNTFKNNIINRFTDLKNGVTDIFRGMINGVIDQLNNGIHGLVNFINFFGQKLDDLATALGTTGTIKPISFVPIPHYAQGTDSHPGGLMVAGEEGPELIMAPPGTKVATHKETKDILSLLGGNGKIPGYADGIGDLGSKILSWIAGGAQNVLDNLIATTHIAAPSILGMSNIASGIFNKVKDWALGWVTKLIPHFDFSSGGGTGQGTPVSIPGNLQSWIAQAMAITGVPGSWAGALAQIALHESGGNPNSVNNWDSNAQAGHPSQGLFQMIPSTFAAHMISGHGNILNPVDSGISAIRYIQGRYGDVFHVPGIQAMAAGQAYVGYANGGVIDEPIAGMGLRTGTKYSFGERGRETVVPGIYLPGGVNLAQSLSQGTAPASSSRTPQELIFQVDGRTFARLNLPYHVAEVRNQVGVRI